MGGGVGAGRLLRAHAPPILPNRRVSRALQRRFSPIADCGVLLLLAAEERSEHAADDVLTHARRGDVLGRADGAVDRPLASPLGSLGLDAGAFRGCGFSLSLALRRLFLLARV